MKTLKTYTPWVLLVSIFIFTSLFFYPKKFSQSNLSSRHPDGLITSGFLAIAEDIYQIGATLGSVPVETVKKLVIDYGIASYLEKLPLKEDVRKRVESRLNDERYMARVVPFLLALKNQYAEPKDAAELKFDSYVRGNSSLHLPGVNHELFNLTPKAKAAEGGFSLSEDLAGNLVSIYDSIFIQGKSTVGDDESLEKPFHPLSEKDRDLIERTKPFIRNLLTKLKEKTEKEKAGKTDPGAANSEAMQMLGILLTNEKKLDAATISLIDFVKYMVHKSYRYFALKVIREIELKDWLYKKLSQGRYDDILNFLELAENRRYAVQIGVDGLQGSLMQALAQPEKNETFLKALVTDFSNAEQLKPKEEPTTPPNHAHNIKFLEYLLAKKRTPESYLPFFKFLYSNYEQNISSGGISTTPTISVRNLPVIFTGAEVAGPNSTGIPNFHFVDRKDQKNRSYYFYGNDALLLETLTANSGMITMFDRLRGVSTLNCNAQYEWHSQASFDGLLNLGIGEGDRDFGEVRCYAELRVRAAKEIELRNTRKQVKSLVEEIKNSFFTVTRKHRVRQLFDSLAKLEQEGMPQYLLMYLPWPDHFAHFKGPFSNEILASSGELNRLDYWLGKITETYKSAGVYTRTLFGMAGDHGLAPIFYTLNPEKTVLEALAKETGREIKVKKISSDEGEGPKINHSIDPDSMKDFDVIIASTAGGNYMMDFFSGQDDASWRQQPLYGDLTQLKLLDGGKPINIINEIASRLSETLDYLVVRENNCSVQECHLHVVGTRDGRQVDDFIIRKGTRIFYVPYDWSHEKSLLDLEDVGRYQKFSDSELTLRDSLLNDCLKKASPDDPTTWCTEDTWRKITSYTSRPDSVVQLSHIYDEDRAGTINLFPRYGIGYNTKVPGRHAGESFHEKDAFMGFWGEPTRNSNLNRLGPTVIGSLAPTIYSFLSEVDLKEPRAGFGFPSVWHEVKK